MAGNTRNANSYISLCSINICGLSDRSKLVLDHYVDKEKYDIVAIQETGSTDSTKLRLSNMKAITDSNKAQNKGAALLVRNEHSITKLEKITENYKNIDSVWGLVVINNSRYIIFQYSKKSISQI